jgi:hypothetical protein
MISCNGKTEVHMVNFLDLVLGIETTGVTAHLVNGFQKSYLPRKVTNYICTLTGEFIQNELMTRIKENYIPLNTLFEQARASSYLNFNTTEYRLNSTF